MVMPAIIIFTAGSIAFEIQNPLFATTSSIPKIAEQPDINTSTIFDTHSMVLGNMNLKFNFSNFFGK